MPSIGEHLQSPTIAAIERFAEESEERGHYPFIRGSEIGKPCERMLWYRFRWVHEPEQFEGRMLRLFDTGHREEARLVKDLKSVGVAVLEVDPDTGEQWTVTALDGHFKGHLDGRATGIIEAPKTEHLVEIKTHNAKSFAQLKKHGVAVSHPTHMAQMQSYMHLAGLKRAFYLAKNKDTDELHVERVHYDEAQALKLMAKGERVRDAHEAPPRVSDDPASFACRFCASKAICHEGAPALRNCRTCLSSSPISGGGWWCERFGRPLSIEDQRSGCARHLFLPSLIDGEQVDADEAAETVTYQMADGTQWVDGAERGAA